ncbi:30455_t:CDS:2 [Racocetra persica]|uniref:30455_t:CDS:1 n=1 Tax=Racocetra persica TaxID=160502 RepID=A0ACA9KN04_9GLOM|nr:30455_t:CDS:2 [Racocetra persica]
MSKNLLQKRTRTTVSESLKREICEYSQKNPNKKQIDIAKHFNFQNSSLNLDRSTISKILNDKSKWLAVMDNQLNFTIFRRKQVKYPLLNQAMCLWVEQVTTEDMILTELMIKEKFKRHNNLKNFWLHGEAKSAPLSLLSEYRQKLYELIEKYTLNNMFNADETELFFHILPDQTLVSQSKPGFKKLHYDILSLY